MWPFGSSYPERQAEDIDNQAFDYIIVGGGTAGCVLASRLSEDPSVSVLLLEKGHVNDNFFSRIPLLSQNYELSMLQATSRLSEPGKEVNGRQTRLWTAEGIGGASRINAMITTRGVPGGYNEWSTAFGLTDWSWDKVEPFFRMSEKAESHPGAIHRGHNGPVVNRQIPLPLACYPYVESALRATGLPFGKDVNDPAASAQGYYDLDIAISSNGERVSSYKAWLNAATAKERQSHLTVCTGVVASRLEVEMERERVTGVHFKKAKAQGSGGAYFVKARREVILCSGAICTPQLLMLSGIGPKSHLVQQGIEVKQDLPAVGQNLSDHNALPVTMDMPTQDTLHSIMSGFGFLWHFVLYVFFGRGLLACTSVLTSIFFRTTSLDANLTVQPLDTDGLDSMDASLPRNIPDAEIMVIPLSCVPNTLNRSQLTWWIALVQPESRGRVELASSDPEVHPRITYPLLDDKRDLVTARKAVRFALRLTDEMSASGYPHPTPMAFGPGMDMEYLECVYADERKPPPAAKKIDWRELSDGEIDKYVRRVCGTALHFSSTCRMSNDSRDGVVDQQLRVHGFSNLRVADASVFPKIPSTHTMAPVMMVAQRCFDFIRREYE